MYQYRLLVVFLSAWMLLVFGSCGKNGSTGNERINVRFDSPERKEVRAKVAGVFERRVKQLAHAENGNSPAGKRTEDIVNPLESGVQDPEDASLADCFSIFVNYPEINDGGACTTIGGNNFDVNEIFGFFDIGTEASANLIAGAQREFYLVVTQQLTACQSIFNLPSYEIDVSAPIVIGSAVTDVTTGTTNINLSGSIAAADRLDECNGGVFDTIGEAFSPKNISGLKAWFDAADNKTVFSDSACTVEAGALAGDLVTCWKDKSGNGHEAIQPTDGDEGVYEGFELNLRNTIYFDGGSFLDTQTVLPSDQGTIFVVFATATAQGANAFFVGSEDGGADDNKLGLDSSAGLVSIVDTDTLNSTTTGLDTGLSYLAVNVWENGTNHDLFLDDFSVDEATATSPAVVITSIQPLFIGASNNSGTAGDFYTGSIGEILIYDRQLTSTELQEVRDYLQSKWSF